MEYMDESSIAIIPTAPVQRRNRDINFAFRPDSNFFYLTGFAETESVAVLMPGRSTGEYVLFCRERSLSEERWHGPLAGIDGAQNDYSADDAFPYQDIDAIMLGLLESRQKIFYAMGINTEFDTRVMHWVKSLRSRLKHARFTIVALDRLLHDMRVYKSAGEIKAIRRAVDISACGHIRAMASCEPGLNEADLESEFRYECMRQGAKHCAYPTIVASGANASIYHYIDNKDVLKSGAMVLIDAGVEHSHYAADITRTYPVNGQFSEQQRLLYEVVLEAQLAAISCVAPGMAFDDAHDAAVGVIATGLAELGVFSKSTTNKERERLSAAFIPRRTGHWMGLDVHDVGDYRVDGESRALEPGMVLTVEPGLYLPADCSSIESKWRGLVIRLEDDILVTAEGREVLSDAVPKSVEALEETIGSAAFEHSQNYNG